MVMLFFFNDTATTEIYTLSLHDALPISRQVERDDVVGPCWMRGGRGSGRGGHDADEAGQHRGDEQRDEGHDRPRSEEHTSELQSRQYLVCRLLLEKK